MGLNSKSKKERLLVKSNRERLLTVSESTNGLCPVFSFKNFSSGDFGLNCESNEFKELVSHLRTLGNITWQQIQNSYRHGLGSEEIKSAELKVTVPECYGNPENVLAFRYSGKKAFLGIRNGQVLDILFIDPKFTIYNH